MALQLGDTAPDFQADTTAGSIEFHAWKQGSWAVLFSHPADFTPVCTTELGRVAQLSAEWAARGAKPIALSVDSVDDHAKWVPDINEVNGTTVDYPIIADPDKTVAQLFGMIHPNEGDTSSVRVVYIIDPANKVRLTLTYPKSVGRNFDEILRALDALQLTDRAAVSTPVDWRAGDRVIVPPTVSTEDARAKFGEVDEVRPYLRFVQAPQA
ncbi:peroxiredoxin [Actinokineospora globicatena]|uniref:Antioxidant protein n=1 Tax=Actinokineospora globicatena TaxID=103729 RepID=A0A9W6QGQ7_9PSEU|nr:peroxiredoxin [Actinokineospora globicatena]MCP2304526.1 1-Cys peroxiredoxin (EC 1.11.1.15) [Actinokineospora globicatena]GLW78105.1 antioxidant protein [Actinokineospora globicatena]GLW85229.1 antioxidant protein [Actinokineospora globicatena]GLW90706.1 antioxidant protein [Actinokineospora globicatena]